MTVHLDQDGFSIKSETTFNLPGPKILAMLGILDILQRHWLAVPIRQHETDGSQVQSKGILLKVAGSRFRPIRGIQLMPIEALLPLDFEESQRLRPLELLRIWIRVPPPIGLGSDRDASLILRKERLKTCQIRGEGRISVSKGEEGKGITTMNDDTISGDERFPIDLRGAVRLARQKTRTMQRTKAIRQNKQRRSRTHPRQFLQAITGHPKDNKTTQRPKGTLQSRGVSPGGTDLNNLAG